MYFSISQFLNHAENNIIGFFCHLVYFMYLKTFGEGIPWLHETTARVQGTRKGRNCWYNLVETLHLLENRLLKMAGNIFFPPHRSVGVDFFSSNA